MNKNNVRCNKNQSKHNGKTLLCLLWFSLHQTLLTFIHPHFHKVFKKHSFWHYDSKKSGKISWIRFVVWKYEFSVRKYLTPLPCTRLLFATGWWVCKSWQVEVKDRAERSEKTLTTMSKESLSDSHLFSHIPMPKLKSTLAKCATFIYSTHKFIKYKINRWTETCGNFGQLLLILEPSFLRDVIYGLKIPSNRRKYICHSRP